MDSNRKIKIPTKTNIKGTKTKWVIMIVIWTFVLSMTLSFASSSLLSNVDITLAVIIMLSFIMFGVIFDMIGVSVTAASETPFHSMASHRVRGAEQAIRLVRNAEKVSNFCNDVIGDICSIICGTITGVIVIKLAGDGSVLYSVIITGLGSALTVGAKALGKGVAISHSNQVVYWAALAISYLSIGNGKERK